MGEPPNEPARRRAPSNFRQRDVARAIKAAKASGLDITRVEVDPRTAKICLIIRNDDASENQGQSLRQRAGHRSGRENQKAQGAMKIEVTMKYVQSWADHLGRRRYRFRRSGYPRVELPVDADPASPEFQAAYHAAMRGEKTNAAVAAVTARGGSGSVKDAIDQWHDSTTFNDEYDTSTKSRRRSLLNSISRMVGNLPLAQMDGNWIERWLETSSTKGVKRTRLLSIKPFFKWAVTMKLIAVDPTVTIKVKVKESAGHHTWTDEELEQYRAHHPLGTMARLALELMLNLASRRRSRIAEVMRAARTTKGRMPD